jgi:hypothetical protein
MRVAAVTIDEYNDNVEFQAVYGNSTNKEDNTYASATPSGSIKLCVNNPAVRGTFKPGDVYYVDFTPAPMPPKA